MQNPSALLAKLHTPPGTLPRRLRSLNDPDCQPLEPIGKKIRRAQKTVEAAIDKRKSSRVTFDLARADLAAEADAARRLYHQIQLQTRLALADDESLADTLFRDTRRATPDPAAEDEAPRSSRSTLCHPDPRHRPRRP